MKQYLDLVQHILEHGEHKDDRTGTGTLSVFGYQMRFDLREGFPLLTTKKVLFSAVVRELLWFLRGATNINDDLKQHTPIWNAWANEEGELGPIYGYQWRKWEKFLWDEDSQSYQKIHIDQIKQAIELIKKDPNSRRIIVSAWNVADIERMALPPCHAFFQFFAVPEREESFGHNPARPEANGNEPKGKRRVIPGRLDCQLYQRSADVALGVPFNIASYALLLTMIAQECDLVPGHFVHTLGDAHVYANHIGGLRKQLERTPKALPEIKILKKNVFDIQFEDIQLFNYQYHDFIKFPIAV